jgi:hypothetical protein
MVQHIGLVIVVVSLAIALLASWNDTQPTRG